MTQTFATKNDLPETTRLRMIAVLNANLASAIDVMLQARQAHWNIKGPDFYQLHEFFDHVHDRARQWVDLIAERAVVLGGVAEGALHTALSRTKIPVIGNDVISGEEYLEALSGSFAAFGGLIRAAARAAEDAGDGATANLFMEVSRGADKMLWFIEAHLQA